MLNKSIRLIKKFPFDTILAVGVLVQTILFVANGYEAFSFVTPFLFYLALAVFCYRMLPLVFRRKPNTAANLRVSVISIVAIIVIIEAGLRLSGSCLTVQEMRIGKYYSLYFSSNQEFWLFGQSGTYQLTTSEYDYSRTANSEGFPDKEWVLEKPDSAIRVLAIGDSFTEGDGAHADSTWLKFLERKTNNRRYEFMNAGMCGSDPVFGYHNFENKLLKYKPDVVLLAMNCSEQNDLIIRGGFERFRPDGSVQFRESPWWECIYAFSYVSRLFFNAAYSEDFVPVWKLDEVKNQYHRNLHTAIQKFSDLCRSNNIEFVCIAHPIRFEIEKGIRHFDKTEAYCNVNNIHYIDLYSYFAGDSMACNIAAYYWVSDGHHNARGYSAMADAIYSGLCEKGLLPN